MAPKRRRKRRRKISVRLSSKQKQWLRVAFAGGLMLVVGTAGCLRISHFLRSREVRKETAVRKTPPPPASAPVEKKVLPKRLWRTRTGPQIAFVIDDIGYTLRNEPALKNLAGDVTFAILPHLAYSEHFGEMGYERGAEVILHLPLEPADGTIPGPGLITTRMDPNYVREQLGRDLQSVPHRVGVNNHMGSYGTTQPDLMRVILQELKSRGLFFLDSQTTTQSLGPRIGEEIGLPVLKRDVFLDNVNEPEAIRGEVIRLREIARTQGHAVAIGHDHENTLHVLEEEIPKLKAEGFEIVSLKELIESSR